MRALKARQDRHQLRSVSHAHFGQATDKSAAIYHSARHACPFSACPFSAVLDCPVQWYGAKLFASPSGGSTLTSSAVERCHASKMLKNN